MGETAERVAERYDVSREDQDAFALRSQARAAAAIDAGHVGAEIAAVEAPRQPEPVIADEHPRPDTTSESWRSSDPAFRPDGLTSRRATRPGINDGAAARRGDARSRGGSVGSSRSSGSGRAVSGIEPEVMGYAPAHAIPKALAAGLSPTSIDRVELNEAFAAQAVAVIRDADLAPGEGQPSAARSRSAIPSAPPARSSPCR